MSADAWLAVIGIDLWEIWGREGDASEEVSRLCMGPDAGRWRMSIPANKERDSDLIISASLADIPRLIAALGIAQRQSAERDRQQAAFAAALGLSGGITGLEDLLHPLMEALSGRECTECDGRDAEVPA